MAVVIQEGDEKIAVDLKEDSNLQAKSHGYLMDGKEPSAGRSSAAPNEGDITCHREFHDNIICPPDVQGKEGTFETGHVVGRVGVST